MDFRDEIKHAPSEPFVPMINVVFLLLIFFLMTAQIAPPPPFETEPPEASNGGDPSAGPVLYLSPEGLFGFAEARGDDAMAQALEAADERPLHLSADRDMDASRFAAALKRLSAAGVARIELTTTQRRAP
ncbi:MAG: biopolymer transporter ExbD [Pseudomonadota bacterium]